MRRIIIIVLIIIILMVTLVHGEKTGVLSEILRPEGIEVSGERLYVVEGATFFVYNLKNLNLIKKFGRAGQGPGELSTGLLTPNSLRILKDKIMAEGFNKIIFFSKDFRFLTEARKKGMLLYNVMPIGGNFVALRMSGGNNKIIFTLLLMGPEMKVIKEIYKQESFDRQRELILLRDTIHFDIYNEKIYVEESDKGFFIEVFDNSGNRLYEIKKNFTVPKVTESDKEAIFNNLKEDKLIGSVAKREGGWEKFKKAGTFTYPGTYPHIQDIIVTDEKIYVSTFDRKDDKEKYIIMDLKGNIISTLYMPITRKSSYTARTLGRANRFYGIANNKFYYIKENEDEEVWELLVTEMK
jgi:hypothetical protein